MLGYLADFPRLNRRMHNKSFTADNQATIIGGRNIGDEYFCARDEGLFLDLDVLALGPVVEHVSRNFDQIGRAHVRTPVTNAHHVCRLLLEKKKKPTCSHNVLT